MRISLINTSLRGGASKSAQRLFLGLRSINQDVHFLVKNEKGKEQSLINTFDSFEHYNEWKKIFNFARKKLGLNKNHNEFFESRVGLEKFSFPTSQFDLTKSENIRNSNVINLHWVADFLDYKSFFTEFKNKNIFWTLHDEAPYSYGEHYNEKYIIDDDCVVRERKVTRLEAKYFNDIFLSKKKIFDHVDNLKIIGPSKWICKESLKSKLFSKFDTYHIPYGINTERFKKINKSVAKDFLGVDTGKPIILFVADNVNDNRKGFKLLLAAIRILHYVPLSLLVVGTSGNNNFSSSSLHDIAFLGRINDERLIALVYNAADLFVIPSLMDNLPNTVIESVCCGTPVIGFNVGGIPDIVESGIAGLLADELSYEALADILKRGLDGLNSFDNDIISKKACQKFKIENQAEAYVELFKNQ